MVKVCTKLRRPRVGTAARVLFVSLPERVRTLRARPLGGRRFVLLASGRTISMLGSAMAPIALAFAVLRLTHSPRDLGLVLAARSVSVVVFLLVGGVISDRLPRHVVMVGSNLVAGASQAAAAALVLSGTVHVWQLAALEAVNGASAAFTLPSTSAALPQTVPEEALRRANAVIRIGVNAASILGAALGGVVVGVAGPGWGIAVDAASFLVAAVLLAGLRLDRAGRGSAEGGQGGSSMLRELAEGWREFRSRRWLWAIVVQFCFVNAAYSGIVNVLGPVVALRHLGGAGSWGIIVAVLGAGLVVGGLVLAWRGVSRMLLAGTVSLFAQVPFLACLAVAAPLPVVAVAALAAGI